MINKLLQLVEKRKSYKVFLFSELNMDFLLGLFFFFFWWKIQCSVPLSMLLLHTELLLITNTLLCLLSVSCKNLPPSLSLLKTNPEGHFVLLGWKFHFYFGFLKEIQDVLDALK